MAGKREWRLDEIQEIRTSPDGIDKLRRRFGTNNRTIKAIREAATDDEALAIANKEPSLKEKEGGSLSTVTQPSKGAILFTLGEHKISLDPQHLYDAYLYYEDIKTRHEIDEEFSLAIKDSMKHAWEQLNQSEAKRVGIKIAIEEG